MSQGDPAEVVPEGEPPSRVDEAHKSRLLVGEALSVVGGVIQVLMNLVADLRAWCALLESRANGAGPLDGPLRRRELADHQQRLTAAEERLARAHRGREAGEALGVVTGRSALDNRWTPQDRTPDVVPTAGPPDGALRECDRVLESADEQLDAFEAQLAAVRAQLAAERGADRQGPVTDAVPAAGSAPVDMRKTAGAAEPPDDAAPVDAPEDRKPPAPRWTTWLMFVMSCLLLLVVVLGGTSFTYARWESPSAGELTAYAAGDLFGVAVFALLSLYILGTLVERWELSSLGETALVLAILLVVPVLVVGLWHPQAFGHMGLWGRSLARSLL